MFKPLNNIENIQAAADTAGGWYVLIEGTEPYYGRLAAWFKVREPEIPETEMETEEAEQTEEISEPEIILD